MPHLPDTIHLLLFIPLHVDFVCSKYSELTARESNKMLYWNIEAGCGQMHPPPPITVVSELRAMAPPYFSKYIKSSPSIYCVAVRKQLSQQILKGSDDGI
jgi:hypothetical protein